MVTIEDFDELLEKLDNDHELSDQDVKKIKKLMSSIENADDLKKLKQSVNTYKERKERGTTKLGKTANVLKKAGSGGGPGLFRAAGGIFTGLDKLNRFRNRNKARHESMNNKQKFENFLENLKGEGQDSLIESVKTGFQACFENEAGRGHYITSTYKTWDEESTEIGDTDDKGWVDQEGESMEVDEFDDESTNVIKKTVEFLSDKGATQGSNNVAPEWWSTTDPSGTRDYYEKGEETYYSYHLNNYTPEERAKVSHLMETK